MDVRAIVPPDVDCEVVRDSDGRVISLKLTPTFVRPDGKRSLLMLNTRNTAGEKLDNTVLEINAATGRLTNVRHNPVTPIADSTPEVRDKYRAKQLSNNNRKRTNESTDKSVDTGAVASASGASSPTGFVGVGSALTGSREPVAGEVDE